MWSARGRQIIAKKKNPVPSQAAGVSGVLLVVKNYTGDRLNFGLAAEQARAQGVAIDMVMVADDCAFGQTSKAGRRGLCGTVFVHKVPCLSPCSVPGCLPSFQLPAGEMELGLGIHGEPGIKRSKVASADEVVKTMLNHMVDPSSQSHLPLNAGDSVVLCMNNLGSLSNLEMSVVTGVAIRLLEERGVFVARVMSGSFMTSLEMAGVSLSLMHVDQEILRLFDAKTTAPAWPNLSSTSLSGRRWSTEPAKRVSEETMHIPGPLSAVMQKALEAISLSLLEHQEELNGLDRAAGDGDCGSTHALAARAIQEWLQGHQVPGCPGQLLSTLAGLVQDKMGGSSGALYSLFLTAAAVPLKGQSDPAAWAKALQAGTEAMKRWGDSLFSLDALCPAVEELQNLLSSSPSGAMDVLQAAVKRAELGAESTRYLTAKAGRASYVGTDHQTLPDPGAVAIAVILKVVCETLSGIGH
uniref:Triokinase/FMN cyclase n=1 Tax=Denticeps clupeoides TaxID=299321 RepID=A0AAY3ZW05_9TELE